MLHTYLLTYLHLHYITSHHIKSHTLHYITYITYITTYINTYMHTYIHPYHTIRYHTIPYHTIPYHTIHYIHYIHYIHTFILLTLLPTGPTQLPHPQGGGGTMTMGGEGGSPNLVDNYIHICHCILVATCHGCHIAEFWVLYSVKEEIPNV